MSDDPLHSLREQIAADPVLRAVVEAVLDRCDRAGSLPARFTLPCRSAADADAAIRLFSASAVKVRAGSARIDLARTDARLRASGAPALTQVLYAAAGRRPRNLRSEAEALGDAAAAAAREVERGHDGAAVLFLRESAARVMRGHGAFFEMARLHGIARLQAELQVTARCIELAETNTEPARLANFARRATGSTKGLRAGDKRYIRVTEALLAFVPDLAETVAAEGPADPADRRRLALECLNIFRNETPIDVLCWGEFALEKQGRRLELPSQHHQLGEPCRLLLLNLRGARVSGLRARRIVTIENETTFNDYIEWLRATGRQEIVLLSEGQANWAVVRLLRMLAEAAPGLPIEHWGDLDRFGVLILRSLRRRTGLDIRPLWMDEATYRRCLRAGLPLPAGERKEIDLLISAAPSEAGTDLLRALSAEGKWIEQESVWEQLQLSS